MGGEPIREELASCIVIVVGEWIDTSNHGKLRARCTIARMKDDPTCNWLQLQIRVNFSRDEPLTWRPENLGILFLALFPLSEQQHQYQHTHKTAIDVQTLAENVSQRANNFSTAAHNGQVCYDSAGT